MHTCGYCYALDAKLFCGKCRKRPYCGKECQKEDWICGHRNWCGIAGELDHDFEIKDTGVVGKGLGVFALRNIKKNELIFAERPSIEIESGAPFNVPSHPIKAALEKLEPIEGSQREKFSLNCIERMEGMDRLYLHFSRINHHCQGNIAHATDNLHVLLVLASRDIKIGEELCYSYISHVDAERYKLMMRWNIDCHCSACSDPEFVEFYRKFKALNVRLKEARTNFSGVFRIIQEQIRFCENSEIYNQVSRDKDFSHLYYFAYQMAGRLGTNSDAIHYAEKALHCQRVLYGNHNFSGKCGYIAELSEFLNSVHKQLASLTLA